MPNEKWTNDFEVWIPLGELETKRGKVWPSKVRVNMDFCLFKSEKGISIKLSGKKWAKKPKPQLDDVPPPRDEDRPDDIDF